MSRAKPAALSVFDLDQERWSASLRAEQYEVFYQRMQGELDASTRPRVLAFTQAEAARVGPPLRAPREHPPDDAP